jgi:hypothetical protein
MDALLPSSVLLKILLNNDAVNDVDNGVDESMRSELGMCIAIDAREPLRLWGVRSVG